MSDNLESCRLQCFVRYVGKKSQQKLRQLEFYRERYSIKAIKSDNDKLRDWFKEGAFEDITEEINQAGVL